MNATLIDGKAAAAELRAEVARQVAELPASPGLATLLVGDDPASAIYVANKRKQSTAVGIRDLHRHLPADVEQVELAAVLDELAEDPEVTGILLQLPLPRHLDATALLARIPPEKDVDGLTERSAGKLALGTAGLRPCTPSGVIHLLDRAGVQLEGADAVVVGRSLLVGQPQAQMLMERNATVTVCHSRTRDVAAMTRRADVIVAAAGVPRMIGADAVKPGAVVIDVGMHRLESGLCGDVDTEAVARTASAITPVPGGVGPMTIAMLLRNTVLAAQLTDAAAVGTGR
ncbi:MULTISPECIES: bifunctional methylenetetrahydrofolate dehydrogenase/methenyltetrahydrofolate cyclohydrolase FolD [Pseudonocardia]|uniref:Bifunctional protein FolD n=2 Tax=Pseudonocardia TaxID=1847 RepID=A0A1Y2MRF7_PSEAH|nr:MULTISPECIES: bifunctional methylenetetrahydrofolate dehydrogenase/methenyltetrahydrofolate cyclohydrolase FolD [Pseudonocardia]OSY37721.1 Bifunctional protein FolD protein [Pseudonocardia autotrophica]TDN75789.1 methenyltetrahydrofolate cyclohydrolase /5,10-methylenetetrahydrofolate dehydrogenase (NADP+) [Pseudonocardia autotrophica]BBF99760.1 bifunctional protein FolD [Pseudonocardia autotrophica]GEC27098.1 bifunctional protein FolD [Pseudonocardia saturnea]